MGTRKHRGGNGSEATQFKPGNPGRPKGTPNKFTSLKREFLEVYNDLGGKEWLTSFARRNPKDFARMLASMLPKNVNVSAEDHALRLAEIIREKDQKLYDEIVVALGELEGAE